MAKRSQNRTTAKTLDSYTITIEDTNISIKPGDNVVMRSPFWYDEPNYIAKIAKILPSKGRRNPHVKVQIHWYYRPEDSIGGRKTFHGRKELFSSDHVDTQLVDTIMGKCNVYTMDEYKELDKVEENDFFCRFDYRCLTGEFSPDAVMVHCKCQMPENPDVHMVECEECGDRFHPACVDMTKEMAKRLEYFFCRPCLSKTPRIFLQNSQSV